MDAAFSKDGWEAPSAQVYSCQCGFKFIISPEERGCCPLCGNVMFYPIGRSPSTVGHTYHVVDDVDKRGRFSLKVVYYTFWADKGVLKGSTSTKELVFETRPKPRVYISRNSIDGRKIISRVRLEVEGIEFFDIPSKAMRELVALFNRAYNNMWKVQETLDITQLIALAQKPELTLVGVPILNALLYGKIMSEGMSKIKGTSPMKIVKEAYSDSENRIGKKALQVIEEKGEKLLKVHGPYNQGKMLSSFIELIAEVGFNLALEVITGLNDAGLLNLSEMISFYKEECSSVVTAVKRMLRHLQGNLPWDVIVDTFHAERDLGLQLGLSKMSTLEFWKAHKRLENMLDAVRNKERDERIKQRMHKLSHLDEDNGTYKIVRPMSALDMIQEGEAMSHCVGFYADEVANGYTTILFLRDSENNRVATIELSEGVVEQVRGRFNSRPDEDVMDFVVKWATKHGFEISQNF